jgi:hypothetical protein
VVRLDRGKPAGPLLEWKVRIFAAGATLAMAGIFLDERWLTVAAIVVLAGGALLRFLPGAGEPADDGDGTETGDSGDAR